MSTASSSASWQICWISPRFSRSTFSFSMQDRTSPEGERQTVSGMGRELMSGTSGNEYLESDPANRNGLGAAGSGPPAISLYFRDSGLGAVRNRAPQHLAED